MSTLASRRQEAQSALDTIDDEIMALAKKQLDLMRPIIQEVFEDEPNNPYKDLMYCDWMEVGDTSSTGLISIDLWTRGRRGGEDYHSGSFTLSPTLEDGREEFCRDFRETCRLKLTYQQKLDLDKRLKKKADLEAQLAELNKELS